jgi:ubiquitin carboxyl-terminal hydrolase L5
MRELGVKGLEVEELYGLDPDLLAALHPVKALVFLFKWIGGDIASMDGKLVTPEDPAFFFAQQTITNACASMALLNAVLNVHDPDVELGEELNNLKAFSEGLDPESKGWTISNSEKIRAGKWPLPLLPKDPLADAGGFTVHNSFARADPYHLEESRPPTSDDDAYHFICSSFSAFISS